MRYLVLNGVPQIASFGPGVVLEYLYRETFTLQVSDDLYEVTGVELTMTWCRSGVSDELIAYMSQVTPWLAPEPENHGVFNNFDGQRERRQFLERILVGNYLRLAKHFWHLFWRNELCLLDEWTQVVVENKDFSNT